MKFTPVIVIYTGPFKLASVLPGSKQLDQKIIEFILN